MNKKHAILITAYKDFEQLLFLVKQFDHNYNIYIHIDKKSIVNPKIIKKIKDRKNVIYIGQDYKVNWGGVNHLKSYMKLSEIALKNITNSYFHLITGQDYPIHNHGKVKFILRNKNDYITCRKMPNLAWKNGGMDRVEYYSFYDFFDAKKNVKPILAIKLVQEKINFKRKINSFLGDLYGGGTYWSLTRDTLNYVIQYTRENPKFIKRFNFTFCPEEIYFQTVIMNSKYCKNVIVNNNLRFIDWNTGRGGYPALLDESDFDKIISSNALFCRKVDMNDNRLIFILNEHINIYQRSKLKSLL